MRGFENGVHSVDDTVNVHLTYVSNDLSKAFNDPTGGKTFADTFLGVNPDVDVLFQVAGKTGNGMLDSVVEHGIYGFGVDVDQWVSYPSGPGVRRHQRGEAPDQGGQRVNHDLRRGQCGA